MGHLSIHVHPESLLNFGTLFVVDMLPHLTRWQEDSLLNQQLAGVRPIADISERFWRLLRGERLEFAHQLAASHSSSSQQQPHSSSSSSAVSADSLLSGSGDNESALAMLARSKSKEASKALPASQRKRRAFIRLRVLASFECVIMEIQFAIDFPWVINHIFMFLFLSSLRLHFNAGPRALFSLVVTQLRTDVRFFRHSHSWRLNVRSLDLLHHTPSVFAPDNLTHLQTVPVLTCVLHRLDAADALAEPMVPKAMIPIADSSSPAERLPSSAASRLRSTASSASDGAQSSSSSSSASSKAAAAALAVAKTLAQQQQRGSASGVAPGGGPPLLELPELIQDDDQQLLAVTMRTFDPREADAPDYKWHAVIDLRGSWLDMDIILQFGWLIFVLRHQVCNLPSWLAFSTTLTPTSPTAQSVVWRLS